MQTYDKNKNNPMLNKAILQLNGIFNVNKRLSQRQSTAPVEKPLETVATAFNGYVHPILTKKDFKVTMDNYTKAVDAYDKKVWAENVLIKRYNKRVDKSRCEKPLSVEQQLKITRFYNSIKPLNTWERNERIEEFNRCNGTIAKKEKIQSIKYHSENVFQSILWHYNQQLYKRQDVRKKLNVYVPGELPHVELHSGWITSAKIDGVKKLRICQRTFRRQRKRLQEAGILVDYKFEGSSRPVKMRINPEILSITDNYCDGKRLAENQRVTEGGRTPLPHNNVSNRTVLNKVQIKANVDKHSNERSSLPLTTHEFSFYQSTRLQGVEKNNAAAEKTGGAARNLSLSDHLRNTIEDPVDFVQQLANHQYDNYLPIRPDILEREAYSGSLDREEFKELVLQDFFKTAAARLYKTKTPFAGSWMKAYQEWSKKKFITPNGAKPANKHIIITKIPELRYRLKTAQRFLNHHPDFNLLFPGDYFDTTRKKAKEGGFEYTQKAWKKHLKYIESAEKTVKNNVLKAKKRDRKATDKQKVDKYIQDFLKGKFSFEELTTKVQQIGNKQLTANLPEIYRTANEKFQIKNK